MSRNALARVAAVKLVRLHPYAPCSKVNKPTPCGPSELFYEPSVRIAPHRYLGDLESFWALSTRFRALRLSNSVFGGVREQAFYRLPDVCLCGVFFRFLSTTTKLRVQDWGNHLRALTVRADRLICALVCRCSPDGYRSAGRARSMNLLLLVACVFKQSWRSTVFLSRRQL